MVRKVETAIERLQECRTALITAAVTDTKFRPQTADNARETVASAWNSMAAQGINSISEVDSDR